MRQLAAVRRDAAFEGNLRRWREVTARLQAEEATLGAGGGAKAAAGHFTVRRLERTYGADAVKSEYEAIAKRTGVRRR